MLEAEDDIAADIRAAMTADPAPAPEPLADIQDVVEAPEAPQLEGQENDGRVRDEHGRFVKKDEVAKPEEKAQPLTASPEVTPEPPKETIRPPTSWSATAKAKFAALDPDIQKEILKREGDIEGGKAQWDAKGEKLNRYEALIAPHREKFAAQGLDEFSAINALLNAQSMLERNPQEAINFLARQYGAQLPNGPQAQLMGFQQPPAPQLDPYALQLTQHMQALQQRLDQQEQAREREELSRLESEVETFRKDNLYFDNVRGDMSKLLDAGLATNLQDAYDKACWANPEIRGLLSSPPQAPKPPAAPGRPGAPAGLSVVGSPGSVQPVPQGDPNSSIEDDVRAALREVTGRV